MNTSLNVCLEIWWWRFKLERTSFWVKIISSLYGNGGGLESRNAVEDSMGSSWGGILKTGRTWILLVLAFLLLLKEGWAMVLTFLFGKIGGVIAKL